MTADRADADMPTESGPTSHDRPTANRTAVDESRVPGSLGRIGRVVGREVRTVARTRTYVVLAAALAAVLLGLTVTGSATAGYVPTVADLQTPLEALVPVVAVAFGYRAIVSDAERGELDVLETYPVTAWEHVLGVYAGRAVGLLVAVGAPLTLAGAAVAVSREEPAAIYATQRGVDSPILFARFVVLTAAFALVVLAVAIALSALANGARSALALAIVALVGLLVGLDLALVLGLVEGVIPDAALVDALAVSPLSAYRGLVFETVITTAAGTGPRAASPLASLVGFVTWLVGSLAIASWSVGR
ncbi:copper ABC transporter permease [Halovivax asiaticus JCM 14624]|uniref:Copper ABC transporter permease n=1 Tax=Halovivax asiaticus JCM 14624 TaxID=1227490 RepID=M0BMA0_9EURY|nr:ABC transporter permease [Halovivax asiaticus]ELZ10759.1 copper ABC transporter permease [Halovivax asiaticus JCM 14624]